MGINKALFFHIPDGKFILELARSKDGEKGGWVSVPRKIFRTPSAATSSTVTPSATASTSAAVIPSPLTASPATVVGGGSSNIIGSYSKNECSNSLSCKYQCKMLSPIVFRFTEKLFIFLFIFSHSF